MRLSAEPFQQRLPTQYGLSESYKREANNSLVLYQLHYNIFLLVQYHIEVIEIDINKTNRTINQSSHKMFSELINFQNEGHECAMPMW
ncbi:CFF_HP2_G0021300.mRNA.1.CDS.1 [Saccharomyces cerevisiae]|nr:CFF_HP2_G0021300.mRNA.1.CDS.1 [Saccharomyces cerevisiae]CAI6462249.1 CFF_HP2_G0021300.mRNA.1.CDS.1 [Saccharomyces cerevisiae]